MRRHYSSQNVDPYANIKYITAATAFFNSLPPLKKLSVKGSMEPEILDIILARHGRSLIDLKLYPFEDQWALMSNYIPYVPITITKAHILQIKDYCDSLQSLSIYIKRTISSPSEVELYTSLAQIKPLQFLFLTLDCSNWQARRDPRPEDEAWCHEDDGKIFQWRSVKQGHVRQNLIKCAVDETLARSIWNVIANHKEGKRLLSLKLYTTGAMNFGMPGQIPSMVDMARNLSRSWLIERGVRDDEQDALYVRELGLQARKDQEEALQEAFEAAGGVYEYEKTHAIFRRIWPAKEAGRHWMHDWTSYPLQIQHG